MPLLFFLIASLSVLLSNAESLTELEKEVLGRYLLSRGFADEALSIINESHSMRASSHFMEALQLSTKRADKFLWQQQVSHLEKEISEETLLTNGSNVIYALSTAAHNLEDFEAAHNYWVIANNFEERHHRRWKKESFEATIENLPIAFDSSFWDIVASIHPSLLAQSREIVPIFVVGMPHSGSELLEQMLNRHSKFFGPNARSSYVNALKYPLSYFYRNGMIYHHSDEIRAATIAKFAHLSAAQTEAITRDIATLAKTFSHNMVEVAKYALEASGEVSKLRGSGVKYFVDTHLENFLNIGLIQLIFPQAVVIDIIRDPLSTLLNNYQQRGQYSDGYGASRCFGYVKGDRTWSFNQEDIASYYLGYLDAMQHWRQSGPQNKLFQITYDQLLTPQSARIALQPVFDALEIDPEDAVFSPHTGDVSPPKLLEPSDSWKNYEKQLKPLIERLAGPITQRLAAGVLAFEELYKYWLR